MSFFQFIYFDYLIWDVKGSQSTAKVSTKVFGNEHYRFGFFSLNQINFEGFYYTAFIFSPLTNPLFGVFVFRLWTLLHKI